MKKLVEDFYELNLPDFLITEWELKYDDLDLDVRTEVDELHGGSRTDDVWYTSHPVSGKLNKWTYEIDADDMLEAVRLFTGKNEDDLTQEEVDNINEAEFMAYLKEYCRPKAVEEALDLFTADDLDKSDDDDGWYYDESVETDNNKLFVEAKKKKKKKPYSSMSITTGDPQYNMDKFNQIAGSHGDGSYMNGTINPGTSGGDSGASGGEGGGMGESLQEQKLFAAKLGDYIEIPDFIQLLPTQEVSEIISKLSPEEEFSIGYVTPVFFYKKLLDKFTLIKLTEMTGYTGVDYREVRNDGSDNTNRIAVSNTQINNPAGQTDYGNSYNKENNKVKSRYIGMRKEYADVNKTVKQADRTIYEIDPATGKVLKGANKQPIVKTVVKDLKTILFYPKKGSRAKVNYYIDLKNGKGFFRVDRDVLLRTIYERIFEVISADRENGRIEDTEDMTEMEIALLHDVEKKAQAVIDSDARTSNDVTLSNGATKPDVRALYTSQVYLINSSAGHYGKSLVEGLRRK